ncbi:MAG: hypothetical protein U1F43_09050 [Myxococcota bacterium]
MLPLYLPRVFAAYQCQRSLVCCRAPVRAPASDEEVPRMRGLLAASDDEGRLIAETLDARRVLDPAVTHETMVWRQRDDGCVNLAATDRACAIHRSAGLHALPAGCRNFPRWVALLPDRVEVAFNLTCPTASRMLASDAEPFALARHDDPSWPYHPTAEVSATPRWEGLATAPLERVLALREAWWAALDRARSDPQRLLAVLHAMDRAPLDGGAATTAPSWSPPPAYAAQLALAALERQRERGDSYRAERFRALAELSRAVGERELADMVDPALERVVAFASAGVQWLGVHDPRPSAEVVRIVARRAMLVIRAVDALCTMVPYPLGTLLADVFAASSFVDA